MQPISYARHQFPHAVIQHAVWLYLRFTLSYRDVEDLLAGIRAELAARHGLSVGQTTIWRFFERHRITVKKKPARGRAGAA